MSRTTILVLVALGAALAGFAFSATAGQLKDEKPAPGASAAAGPQRAALGWQETFGEVGEQLVFSVDSLQVVQGGWQARVGLENDTSVSYEVGGASLTLDPSFGLMLFSRGALAELKRRNKNGTLPPVRRAVRFEPSLPTILEPGASWSGTMSAPGALVAHSWVRVVFGAFVSVGKPPEDLDEQVVWITDRSYRLRR
jgi:hypothetical protein